MERDSEGPFLRVRPPQGWLWLSSCAYAERGGPWLERRRPRQSSSQNESTKAPGTLCSVALGKACENHSQHLALRRLSKGHKWLAIGHQRCDSLSPPKGLKYTKHP